MAPPRSGRDRDRGKKNKNSNPQDSKLRHWRFSTTEDSVPERPLTKHARSTFFQEAFELLAGDVGSMHEVIQALASDGGLKRVLQLVKDDIPSPINNQKEVFQSTVLPFLKVLSYPKVISSGLLESSVATIYNTIFGPGGQHTLKLFKLIAAFAHELSLDELAPTIATFSKILDLNETVKLIDEFKSILASLESALGGATDDRSDLTAVNARKWIERSQIRLGIGGPAIGIAHPGYKSSGPRAQFCLLYDAPGHLSKAGPRHDNDSEDVRQIQILPTFQEIISERNPYLPVLDPSQLHLPGIDGLIDRHFRLYREEAIGEIRDAVKFELDRQKGSGKKLARSDQGIRMNIYTHVSLQALHCDRWEGLGVTVSIDQPKGLQVMTAKQRQEWWESNARLQAGSLVCLLDPAGHVLFCTVADIDKRKKREDDEDAVRSGRNEDNPWLDLSSNPRRALVTVAVADERDLPTMADYFSGRKSSLRMTLLEFPKTLLQAFYPTLAALQSMLGKENLPFADFLVPSEEVSGEVEVGPPTYSQQRSFQFDLSCLMTNQKPLALSPNVPFDIDTLTKGSTLDVKQAEALVHALTRRLALCQGPPGTGKSYTSVALTRVLLSNKKKADLGPMLVVTYTNHALDQTLEHLLDNGIARAIRIGSRSKSEQLEDLNLRIVSKRMERTRTEKHEGYLLSLALRDDAAYVNRAIGDLITSGALDSLNPYLKDNYPKFHRQFWGKDKDGFKRVARSKHAIHVWLRGNASRYV